MVKKTRYKLIHGDCLEVMRKIPDKSIDLILCDLPFAVTGLSWDVLIPFDKLWSQYERIIKPTSAIVLYASQPFTTHLINSNLNLFKYCIVWEKNRPSGVAHAKNKFMACHEDICIFSKGATIHKSQSTRRMIYNPQGLIKVDKIVKNTKNEGHKAGCINTRPGHKDTYVQEFTNYPKSVLKFDCETKPIHPTQKPVPMLEYLIRTFTSENDLVLDNTMGSGSTGVAALNTKRRFIGIEKEEKYYDIAVKRLKTNPRKLF